MPKLYARSPRSQSAERSWSRFRGADGRRWLTRGLYRDVVPHRLLVHTWPWKGSEIETLVTVEFDPDSPGRTRLTLTHARFAEDEARDEDVQGWRRVPRETGGIVGGMNGTRLPLVRIGCRMTCIPSRAGSPPPRRDTGCTSSMRAKASRSCSCTATRTAHP